MSTNTHSTNGYNGNALSDQPIDVQRMYAAQLQASPAAKATSLSPRDPAAEKFIDPALLQAVASIFGQFIGAFAPAQKGDPTKFIDPALIAALGGLIGQVISAVGARTKEYSPNSDVQSIAQKGNMRQEYVLQNGHFETFPTWSFWGETTIRMDNTGSVPTTALVNDQRFHLNPGEGTTTSGKWAAFPVRVTNSSEHPGAQLTVRVW